MFGENKKKLGLKVNHGQHSRYILIIVLQNNYSETQARDLISRVELFDPAE